MLINSYQMLRRLMLLLLLLPTVVFAQSTRQLTLKEAITLARQHSNSLRADSLQNRIRSAQTVQAANGRLPGIAVNSTFQRLSNNITPFVISLPEGSFAINPQILNQSYNALQLRQLLFGGGKLSSNIKALQKEEAAGREDYRTSTLELEQQITDLWFNLYNARASEQIMLGNIDALSKRRDELEKYRIQGIVLANDVLKIELAVTSLRSSLADIAALAGSLNYNLCVLTGIGTTTNIQIPEIFITIVDDSRPLQAYLSGALVRRPELAGIKLRTDAATYRVSAAKADYLPTISLIGSYNYDRPNQRIIPNLPRFNYSALVGLNLSWRLSSFYANQAHVSENRLAVAQLQSNLAFSRENVQQEVNTNYLNYRKTLEKIQLTRTELEQATENYRVEQNKLNAQTTTPTDFLSANASLLQAQLNLASAKANAELAYHKLLQSTAETTN